MVLCCALILSGAGARAGVTFGPSYGQVSGSPFAVGSSAYGIAVNPAGTFLAVADYATGALDVESIDPATGALTGVANSPVSAGRGPDAVAFSPNGQLVAEANLIDDSVEVFSVSPSGSLSPVSEAATGASPRALAFSPGGKFLAVANYGDDTVSVFSVSAGGALTAIPESLPATGAGPVSLSFAPGGNLLAVANEQDSTVSVYTVDPNTGLLTPSAGSPLGVGDAPAALAFSPTGTVLAVADAGSSDIAVFTTASAAIGFRDVPGSPFATGNDPLSLAFNDGGDLLATANSLDGTLGLFSVGSDGALTLAQGAPFPSGVSSRSVVFVPNSSLVAVGSGTVGSVSVLAPLAPPTVTVAVPTSGQTFVRGARVRTSFTCTDSPTGAGIRSCRDGAGHASGKTLDTSRLGRHSYTVTAISRDGLRATASVRYTVLPVPPVAATPPTIVGKPEAGHVLRCSAGRWRGHPTSFSFQWERGGVALAGATQATHRIGLLDEGSQFACLVTARNGNVAQVLSPGVTVPLAATRHCPAPTGKLTGRKLGGLRLGESRYGVRLATGSAMISSAGHLEQVCVRPSAITVGYEDHELARLLPYYSAHDQVLWILTANPHYSTRGVGPGVALTTAEHDLGHGTLHRLGSRLIYLVRTPAATLMLVAKDRVVTQIGIAEDRLTAHRRLVAALLASLPG